MKSVLRIFGFTLLFLAAIAVAAQTPAAPPDNLYGLGMSYNSGASPAVAGNAFYAKLLSANQSTSDVGGGVMVTTFHPTYSFTLLDILPDTVKPFSVTTNISSGIAQQVFQLGPVNLFTIGTAGLSVGNTNLGWTWTAGAFGDYNFKKAGKPTKLDLIVGARTIKSSVSGGSGYQIIPGAGLAYRF